jgi:hypothetical protein
MFFFFNGSTALVGLGLLTVEASRSYPDTPHSSGRVIIPIQRPLPLPHNTQHSQETDLHAVGGIRTHNPSKQAAADPRLRRRSHWGRRVTVTGKRVRGSEWY